MGTLSVDRWTAEFEDRLLIHLQIVIVNRFRQAQSLLVSWTDSRTIGGGRSSIWLTPTASVYFRFSGSRSPEIDPEWLRRLETSASASTGLIVTDEHGALYRAGGADPAVRVARPALSRVMPM